jgi:ComF family protein
MERFHGQLMSGIMADYSTPQGKVMNTEVASSMAHASTKLLRSLAKALYPPRCAICRAPGHDGMDICAPCYRELPWITSACSQCALPLAHESQADALCGRCQKKPPRFDSSISLFRYDANAMQLVQQLKFNQRLAVSRLLGEMMMQKIVERQKEMPECIIPVPLYRKRLRKRGFNQSIEIARPLANGLDIPIDLGSVVRASDTRPQTGLDRDSRRKNIKGAFETVSPPPYAHIALIDDVVTTGSTANELARVLKRAGVQRVDVWSVARAI